MTLTEILRRVNFAAQTVEAVYEARTTEGATEPDAAARALLDEVDGALDALRQRSLALRSRLVPAPAEPPYRPPDPAVLDLMLPDYDRIVSPLESSADAAGEWAVDARRAEAEEAFRRR